MKVKPKEIVFYKDVVYRAGDELPEDYKAPVKKETRKEKPKKEEVK